MTARWRKVCLMLVTGTAFAAAGVLTGAALGPVSAEPVAAGCENDECEGGSSCKMNSTTGCDVVTGGCKTVACFTGH